MPAVVGHGPGIAGESPLWRVDGGIAANTLINQPRPLRTSDPKAEFRERGRRGYVPRCPLAPPLPVRRLGGWPHLANAKASDLEPVGSTGRIRPGRGRPAGAGWGWPSPRPSSRPMAARSGFSRLPARARYSTSGFRRRQPGPARPVASVERNDPARSPATDRRSFRCVADRAPFRRGLQRNAVQQGTPPREQFLGRGPDG